MQRACMGLYVDCIARLAEEHADAHLVLRGYTVRPDAFPNPEVRRVFVAALLLAGSAWRFTQRDIRVGGEGAVKLLRDL